MKKFFRGCTIVLGTGVGLLLLAGSVLYMIGMQKLTKSYPDTSVEAIPIPTGEAAIARGKHIAVIWACTKCHGEDLRGTLIEDNAFLGTIPAPNLTSGNGGIAISYTDEDWVRAIRYGVKPDGQVEIRMNNYYTMSNQDLGNLIAYLKQIPPVDSNLPAMRIGPILPLAPALGYLVPAAEQSDHAAPRPAEPVPGATIEYGKYLSAICTGCHKAKNIGYALKDWSQEDFVRAFHNGVLPNGKQLNPAMPLTAFSEMNEPELTALWLYFHSLRPPTDK
jgi:cytochrome c553